MDMIKAFSGEPKLIYVKTLKHTEGHHIDNTCLAGPWAETVFMSGDAGGTNVPVRGIKEIFKIVQPLNSIIIFKRDYFYVH
jgi:hypothetical protein